MVLSCRRSALAALCILLPAFLLYEAYTVYANGWPLNHDFSQHTGLLAHPNPTTKTSQIHYLMPASSANELLCVVIASALVNRYPVPYMLGWRGEGKFDAKAAHTGKLHSLKRYLDTLPHGGEPDDLVIFGDGHDVMAQLPADVVVERYFQVAADADRRLADRFGISVEEAHERGLRQTLFWGADKLCWPPMHAEAQCTSIPFSHLPRNKFGPKSENGKDKDYNDARFFNSGSVIGRLDDLRRFINAGLAEVEATYDPEFKWKNSDQLYLARLFARQEVSRVERIQEQQGVVEVSGPRTPRSPEPRGEGGRDKTKEAEIETKTKTKTKTKTETETETEAETEFHVAIDYESDFVQTGCNNHRWMAKLNYNNSDNTATMSKDVFDQGENFKPHSIQMPANVYQSFLRIFDSLPDRQSSPITTTTARDWIGSLKLDTNVVSQSIFGFYHATCGKKFLIADFKSYWFHPLLKPLLRASYQATQAGQPITQKLIDGRRWEYKTSYPDEGSVLDDQLGGIFTDLHNETFIDFRTLCADSWDIFDAANPL